MCALCVCAAGCILQQPVSFLRLSVDIQERLLIVSEVVPPPRLGRRVDAALARLIRARARAATCRPACGLPAPTSGQDSLTAVLNRQDPGSCDPTAHPTQTPDGPGCVHSRPQPPCAVVRAASCTSTAAGTVDDSDDSDGTADCAAASLQDRRTDGPSEVGRYQRPQ